MASSFPIGSKVILQDLVKGAQYNGMNGIVNSLPDLATSRQNIYVHAANKSLAVKPINLRYEPRELESLSIEEMSSLLFYVKRVKADEITTVINIQASGEIGVATGVLQTMVRERIGECPNDLAQLLAEIESKEDEFTAKCIEASKKVPSSLKEDLPPSEYLKGRYKQHAKRDAKEEGKQCCNRCGKTNVKLAKCGRCLSVFYCSKVCQETDHATHKKECKHLLKQRVEAANNDVDDLANSSGGIGGLDVPRIGVALSESITGVHGEVICHLPCWLAEDTPADKELTRRSLDARAHVTRSIRYFFKVYQSSVEAAKSLSLNDVGGLCLDAMLLYWMKCPGVRRVYAKEATSGKFTLQFMTCSKKPDGWSIVGFEDRFAKIMEEDWPNRSKGKGGRMVTNKKGRKKGKKKVKSRS